MKLVSYEYKGKPAYGRMQGDTILPLGSSLRIGLRDGIPAEPVGEPVALQDVRLLPVLPDPAKIFCVGHNYEEHRLETKGPVVGHPSIFTRFADTLSAHEADIPLPPESSMLDFEGEIAVVIGKGGRRIAEADAMAHVAGFACANDATIRDFQRHTQQFTPGKNFPATAPIGPFLVTPKDILDLPSVSLTTRVNGEVVQRATVGQMIFSIPRVIAYLSIFTPLKSGDVILTGTPGGVGARREPPLWLKAGDIVEVEVSQVGLLRNTVAAEA